MRCYIPGTVGASVGVTTRAFYLGKMSPNGNKLLNGCKMTVRALACNAFESCRLLNKWAALLTFPH